MPYKKYKQTKEHRNKIEEGNRGKSVSSETRAKISKTLTGRKLSEVHKRKISDGNRGKIRTEEYKQKLKNRIYSEEWKRKISESHKGAGNPNWGKPISFEVKKKITEANSGENHWNWQGGITKHPYGIEWTKKLREKIKTRDDYICQNCNTTEEEYLMVWGRVLAVHHIDYNKQNNKENNLITLCHHCNIRANYRKEYWQEFYREKINEIYYKMNI